VVAHFHGSEVRAPSVELARNPFYVPFAGESDIESQKTLQQWAEITGGTCVISDIGLEEHVRGFFPNVHFVPLAVDTTAKRPTVPTARGVNPLVVHAPSEISGKGTALVRNAVKELRMAGIGLEYRELTDVSHAEVVSEIQRADIVIDQLRGGTYGRVTVEGMAAGKPVLVYIQNSLIASFPNDLPVINANPDSISQELSALISDSALRLDVGKRSRAFAEREHSLQRLGQRLAQVYADIGSPVL